MLAFAAFTLLANTSVWLGGSLDSLLIACAGAIVLTGGAVAVAQQRRKGNPAATANRLAAPSTGPIEQAPGLRISLIAGAIVATAAGAWTGSPIVWWAFALVTMSWALAWEIRNPVAITQPARTRSTDGLLIGLGLLMAVAVAIAHRSDADDSFYVNLVVAAIDHPGAPLLAGDTLHGYAGVSMALPVFKVLSWEMLQAGVGRVFGLDALSVVHRLTPPLVALAIPLAIARLAMRLLPTTWPWALAFVVAQLLLVGDGRAGYGDFGVLRLHQGKSVLLQIALPLCAAYGLEFGRRPTRAGWIRLAAIQIAAVGLSASGLWLGPLVAGFGLLSAMPLQPRALARRVRDLALGVAASAYPVLLAASLRTATLRTMREAVHPLEGSSWDGPQLMAHASDLVLGGGSFQGVALFSLIAATAAFGAPALRRFAAISGAVFLVIFFDPFTARLVSSGITGADTFFRVFWMLPVPLLVAAMLTSPLVMPLPIRLAASKTRAGLAVALAAGVLGFTPQVFTLSAENGVRIAAPGLKLPAEEFRAARTIAAHASAEAFVLAPLPIARWVPLIQRHPRPLVVREMYLDRLYDRLGQAELDRRRALVHLVGGTIRPKAGPALLADAIDRYPLDVVCLSGSALGWSPLRRVLRESPLEVVSRTADHEIWARSETPRKNP